MPAHKIPPNKISANRRSAAPLRLVVTTMPTRLDKTLSQSDLAKIREYNSLPPGPFKQFHQDRFLIQQPFLKCCIPSN